MRWVGLNRLMSVFADWMMMVSCFRFCSIGQPLAAKSAEMMLAFFRKHLGGGSKL